MDLIDRHGATSKMFEICDMVENELLHIDVIIDALENLPSAESRKKGKWVDNTFCSECGWIHEVESGFIGNVNQFNFCPNCGSYNGGEE